MWLCCQCTVFVALKWPMLHSHVRWSECLQFVNIWIFSISVVHPVWRERSRSKSLSLLLNFLQADAHCFRYPVGRVLFSTHCAWQYRGVPMFFFFSFHASLIHGLRFMPTIWGMSFSYFHLGNSFSLSPTGFSGQNLAGAIVSLCKMECLQHLPSLGKFSKRC